MRITTKFVFISIVSTLFTGCFLNKAEIEKKEEALKQLNKEDLAKSGKISTMTFTISDEIQFFNLDSKDMNRSFAVEYFVHNENHLGNFDMVNVTYEFRNKTNKFVKDGEDYFIMELKNCSDKVEERITPKTKETIKVCKSEVMKGKAVLSITELGLPKIEEKEPKWKMI